MIDKRLVGLISGSMKYVVGNVICQWCSLLANIAMMTAITRLLAGLFVGSMGQTDLFLTAAVALAAMLIRFLSATLSAKMSFLSSKAVKKTLRERIYTKLLSLGASYKEQVMTSEVVQVAVEGVDQLETYFGAYLPQFFYAMLAPFTLFIYLCFVNVPSAIVLLVCVPLIPVAIAAVQTWAKKLLGKYWGQYTELGDIFLENLQGLTTLKIYQADEFKQEEMNDAAEKFRKITMKVLTMQLNSITIMDLIAYGGAALGVIMAATQYRAGHVTLAGCLLIILLAADFFIPMRQLGSYFHVAMNGMAASDKIFRLLDLPEPEQGTAEFPKNGGIHCRNLHFSYEPEREILHGIDMDFPVGSFTSIVGESGCGKSTVAAILMGRNRGYQGSIIVGETEAVYEEDAYAENGHTENAHTENVDMVKSVPETKAVEGKAVNLSDITEKSLMENITYISHQSYLFKGTVRDNLLMGAPDEDAKLWSVLERVNLAEFLRGENGLDTLLTEQGANLSGGQRQRLALARALLHDSPIYIFDEATSNIDVESENDIMAQIHEIAKEKTVILISHRLANVVDSDCIYVMGAGRVTENGRHEELLEKGGTYAGLWNTQQSLELYGK